MYTDTARGKQRRGFRKELHVPAIGLNHVSINARSLEESVEWYRELFGMMPIPTPNFGFPVQWLSIDDVQQLHLFVREEERSPTAHHLALVVDDFDEVYRKAKAMGAIDETTFGYHLNELPGSGQVQLYLRDPGGNAVEVNCPDVNILSDETRADMVRLADRQPQSDENMKARLYV
jgi:glyoxylase I family protein